MNLVTWPASNNQLPLDTLLALCHSIRLRRGVFCSDIL